MIFIREIPMGGHGLAWAAYERQGEGWEESEAATFLEEDELSWPLLLPVGSPLLLWRKCSTGL